MKNGGHVSGCTNWAKSYFTRLAARKWASTIRSAVEDAGKAALPLSGAMGQPSECRFWRIFSKPGWVGGNRRRSKSLAPRAPQIKQIATFDGPLATAEAGDAVTKVLDDEINISHRNPVVHPQALAEFQSPRIS